MSGGGNTHACGGITEGATRQNIVQVANSLLGSHYNLGSGGDAPQGIDSSGAPINGVPYGNRGMNTDLVTPSKDVNSLAIKTAACWGAGSRYVCIGRPFGPQVGGKVVAANDPELTQYLATVDLTNPAPGFNGLYPRRVVGKGVTMPDQTTSLEGKIVWGEDCTTKQHFDCVYFCMYCYWKSAPQINWWMDIIGWATNDRLFDTIPLDACMWPGDILIKCKLPGKAADGKPSPMSTDPKAYHHIGIFDGAGSVVQAEMSCSGVVTIPYNNNSGPDPWKLCRRPKFK